MNPQEILFGKLETPPKKQTWSVKMGFSWTQWLDESEQTLNEVPKLGDEYRVRFHGNFSSSENATISIFWLPAISSINGFDESNISEITQLRFFTGTISSDPSERTIRFRPTQVLTPFDLVELEAQTLEQIDALTGVGRREYSHGRFKCVEFSAEGDITSQFIFIDDQLIMLEDCVWNDSYFWIGNGSLPEELYLKLFPTKC